MPIRGPLRLGTFVKLCGAASTGGQAKLLIQEGAVRVNGAVERRRGHMVAPGDVIEVEGRRFTAQRS